MTSLLRERAKNVCCLRQLLEEVNRIGDLWEKRWSPIQMRFWFRGIDNSTFSLDPGLLRPPYIDKDLENLEYSISTDFRIRGRPYCPTYPLNPWDQIFLMQHYGFPTRLLDWTESLVVAAYFAARDIFSNFEGAIWLLSPQWLVHSETGEYATHVFAGHQCLDLYKLREFKTDIAEFNKHVPLPIIPDHFDARIISQHGRFTIHTFKPGALEQLGNEDCKEQGDACFLQQIKIPPCAKAAIRQQAHIFGGASEDTLFPDLEGLSRGMRWEALEKAKKIT